jgi:hypothetical protein
MFTFESFIQILRVFASINAPAAYVEGGVDEDQAHAEKMDEWIVWEAEEEGARRSPGLENRHHPSLFFVRFVSLLSFNFVRGTHTPRKAHSARWGRRISFVVDRTQGRRPVSFVKKVHIPLRGEGHKTRIKQTNKQTLRPRCGT